VVGRFLPDGRIALLIACLILDEVRIMDNRNTRSTPWYWRAILVAAVIGMLAAVAYIIGVVRYDYRAGDLTVEFGLDPTIPLNLILGTAAALLLVLTAIVGSVWARSREDFLANLRSLSRSPTNSYIGGVCGGLGEHTIMPAWAWRLGFLALLLLGVGVGIYVLLWLSLPQGDPRQRRTGLEQAGHGEGSPSLKHPLSYDSLSQVIRVGRHYAARA
jgi:phage shock protein C